MSARDEAPVLVAVLDGITARSYSSAGVALAKVVELHADDAGRCAECVAGDGDGVMLPWPCRTIMAIGEAMGAGYERTSGLWHDGQGRPS